MNDSKTKKNSSKNSSKLSIEKEENLQDSKNLNEESNNIEEINKNRENLDKISIRKAQAQAFEKYIYETGISNTFQLIFSELIIKKIPMENYFTYTASRLRQFGRELDENKNSQNNENN
jgi:hypothetical protein